MTDDIYDPSIQALLELTEEDWGDPIINRTMLVPYGIPSFDKFLYGIDTYNGELILVIGQEKQRKTTFAINIVINYMTAEALVEKPVTVIDTLESGMHPSRYRDQMLSNLASRYLIEEEEHYPWGRCNVCQEDPCKVLKLTPEFLRYNSRNRTQKDALDYAMDEMNSWPLFIFGANPYQGNTRNLMESIRGDKVSSTSWHYKWAEDKKEARQISRWEYMIHEYDAKIFISDHVQQYSFGGEPSDYEKQLRAVAAIGDIVAKWSVATLLLSQVSLTSVRETRNTAYGKLGAMGGSKGAQEANVIFSTHYNPQQSKNMIISIEDSRKSGAFNVRQQIEARSGAFFGKSEMFRGKVRTYEPDED